MATGRARGARAAGWGVRVSVIIQAAFVREYRLDLNATQAAVRAGYSSKTASIIGHENLRKPKIKAVLAESEAKALAKADLSAQNVLEAIRRHLMRDVRQLVDKDGKFKPLHELTREQSQIIDKIVEDIETCFHALGARPASCSSAR